jgi:hypothetical protein
MTEAEFRDWAGSINAQSWIAGQSEFRRGDKWPT